MIEVAATVERPWPDDDWETLADKAVKAAIAASPHAPLLDAASLVEVSLRLTTDDEVRALNRQYRGKDKATNVLSFPMVQADLLDAIDGDGNGGELLLGDIVLAHGVCVVEAAEKGVSAEDHATHLLVHGTLHLLGYDHERGEADATAMEEMERIALATLGIRDPYEPSGN